MTFEFLRLLFSPWLVYLLVLALVVVIVVIWYYCHFYPVTTVLLVRHADISAPSATNPPLDVAGQARAQVLVHVAGEAGVTAIYATQYVRTQQTVEPLGAYLGLSIVQVSANDVVGLVSQLLSDHAGEVVFVAGHSNTVPQIVERIGGDPIPAIGENEFDNLFVVTRFGVHKAKAISLKYGSPT